MRWVHKDRGALGLLFLRLGIGTVFAAHGWSKLFGDGVSFVQEMLAIASISLPDLTLYAVAVLEFVAGLALITGAFTRPFAAILCIEMLSAAVLFHAGQGFFIVSLPNAPLAYGFEYHVALISGLLCLSLAGPGTGALGKLLKSGRER
jgi:putative oxidoreductase